MSDWEDDGGGDDDWGDDAAGGDDDADWGADGGDDWAEDGDADFGNSEVDANDINIQVANTFYEAESEIKSDPKKAMEFFIKVIELSKGDKASELNDESKDAVFQVAEHTFSFLCCCCFLLFYVFFVFVVLSFLFLFANNVLIIS